MGLAVAAAIAASVTEQHASAAEGLDDRNNPVDNPRAALMEGYRAAFWAVFAATVLVVVVSYFGLEKGGTVGKKDE